MGLGLSGWCGVGVRSVFKFGDEVGLGFRFRVEGSFKAFRLVEGPFSLGFV